MSELADVARSAFIFGSVVRDVVTGRFLESALPEPLAVADLFLLELLALPGAHPVGQVAVLLGVSPTAGSKRAEKFVRLGLATRSSDRGDRRVACLSLTESGRDLLEAYCVRERQVLARADAGMPDADLTALAGLLDRLSLALLAPEAQGPDPDPCFHCGGRYRPGCAIDALRPCPFRRIPARQGHAPRRGPSGAPWREGAPPRPPSR